MPLLDLIERCHARAMPRALMLFSTAIYAFSPLPRCRCCLCCFSFDAPPPCRQRDAMAPLRFAASPPCLLRLARDGGVIERYAPLDALSLRAYARYCHVHAAMPLYAMPQHATALAAAMPLMRQRPQDVIRHEFCHSVMRGARRYFCHAAQSFVTRHHTQQHHADAHTGLLRCRHAATPLMLFCAIR